MVFFRLGCGGKNLGSRTIDVMAYLGYNMESEELRRATKEGWRVRFMGKVLLCRFFEINVSFP